MRKQALMALAILTVPVLSVSAQRRGGGGAPPSGDAAPSTRMARPATVGQIEDLNPARMLVDKRKKLALADSQVNQLKALEKKIKERNAPLLAQYDSVRSGIQFGSSAPGSMGASMGSGSRNRSSSGGGSAQTPEEAAQMRQGLMALRAIGAQIRERRPADLAEALALLTPDQQKAAEEFVKEQDAEAEKLLPMGGRGG